MTNIFQPDAFPANVAEGDCATIEADGYTVEAFIYADNDAPPPWEREDGHGPVSGWTTRPKKPGEWVLSRDRDGWRYYAAAAARVTAERDGWGLDAPALAALAALKGHDPTPAEIVAEGVRLDFVRLREWCNDAWAYVGVAVQVTRGGVPLTTQYGNALWGIESDAGPYLAEVANDLAREALAEAREKAGEIIADLAPLAGPDRPLAALLGLLNYGRNHASPGQDPELHKLLVEAAEAALAAGCTCPIDEYIPPAS